MDDVSYRSTEWRLVVVKTYAYVNMMIIQVAKLFQNQVFSPRCETPASVPK
jgi:hypothetical protein